MQIDNEDNGWYERGELPPVGSKVEHIGINDIHAQNVEVVCHFDAQACRVAGFLRTTHCGEIYIDQAVAKLFRPIKSERERAIESAAEIIRNEQGARAINSRDCPHKASAVALANAGLLRLPESDR